MLSHAHKLSTYVKPYPSRLKFRVWLPFQFAAPIGSLREKLPEDPFLDNAIQKDKKWILCAKVVKEVVNEPKQVIPVRDLEKRRDRLRLPIRIETFIKQNSSLFDTYMARIKRKTELIPFIRISDGLRRFLEEEKRINLENEPLIVAKLCKLLLMSKDRVVSLEKLALVKKEFGFPNDFLVNLVPKYPEYFNLLGSPGEEKSHLELVSWNPEIEQSVVQARAEEEEQLKGIKIKPSFNVTHPPECEEMEEWIRDWMELPYISPYEDPSSLDPESREMEKRMVGVFHELLSLSLFKRIPLPILSRLGEEYEFSKASLKIFSKHSGIFYLSQIGDIKTAMLREAYKGDELIDRDPLLEIKDKFVELLEEGCQKREVVRKDKKMMAVKNSKLKA